MTVVLSDSELKVMSAVWNMGGSANAKDINAAIKAAHGYTRGAVYTLINRLIEKGALIKEEPGFLCRAAITKDEVRHTQTRQLIDKLYGGSADDLVVALVSHENISDAGIERLRKLIEDASR